MRKGENMYLFKVIMIVVVAVLAAILTGSGEQFMPITNLWDIPSLCMILLIVIPILWVSGVGKSVSLAFRMILTGKWDVTLNELKKAEHGLQVLMSSLNTAGIFASVYSVLVVLSAVYRYEGMEMKFLCANLAVAILPLVYALIFRVLLIPIKAIVERHIIDFMEDKG